MARIHDSNYEVTRQLREITDSVILWLSGGKDSIAALTVLHDHGFKIYPVKYGTLTMSFQDKYMDYLSRKFKLPPVLYLPHPDVIRGMKFGRYTKENPELEELKFTELETMARDHWKDADWMAGGEKMVDSLHRRGMIHKCKGLEIKRRRAFPLADWNDRDTYAYLKRRRIPLPADYNLFGSSYTGAVSSKQSKAIRDHHPEDFELIRTYFPLADAAAIKQDMLDRETLEDV